MYIYIYILILGLAGRQIFQGFGRILLSLAKDIFEALFLPQTMIRIHRGTLANTLFSSKAKSLSVTMSSIHQTSVPHIRLSQFRKPETISLFNGPITVSAAKEWGREKHCKRQIRNGAP